MLSNDSTYTIIYNHYIMATSDNDSELLECLKSWFRLGIFTEEDLYAIVGTMEEGGTNALDFLA